MAEKIYKIQKELQEKKQRRLEQAQNRLQGPPGSGPGSVVGSASSSFDLTPAPNRTVSMDSLHRAPATAAALASSLLTSVRIFLLSILAFSKEVILGK